MHLLVTCFVEVYVGRSSKSLSLHCWRVTTNWLIDQFFLFKPVWKLLLRDVMYIFWLPKHMGCLYQLFKYLFWVINFEVNIRLWTTCNILPCNQSIHTVKRLYNLFEKVFVIFPMQSLPIHTFFVSYLKSHCIEVPHKRSFLLMGPKKLVPLSESPFYPASQLSEVFLV